LTPGRSLAVDLSCCRWAPLWLDTTYPPRPPKPAEPLRRLVVAQDSGGAIKAQRGDLLGQRRRSPARRADEAARTLLRCCQQASKKRM
jgi:membrane-bound lytic murein transglycosylase A